MKLETIALEKWYLRGKGDSNRFYAVQKTELTLQPGTVTVLTGRSGSGKTTPLNMMAGLLTPDSGRVEADGRDLYAMRDDELSRFRNRHFGMLPQTAGMLQSLTVMENILLPQGIYGTAGTGAHRRTGTDVPGKNEEAERGTEAEETAGDTALTLLERMGIRDLAEVYPKELSGGELRRAAAARALAGKPDVIFADEPMSDLDDENMGIVLALLREAADRGAAVFLVTHDSEALEIADIRLEMKSGLICPC